MDEQPARGASKKHDQIVLTAERLFTRHGARRVSVEELCKRADVSKMTFYKYFRNKGDLIRFIAEKWTDEGFRKFDEINALDLPFPEKIQLMTRWKVEFSSRISADFIKEIMSLDGIVEKVRQKFIKNIIEAQKKGEIRKDIRPELLLLISDKMNEIIQEDLWKAVFSNMGEFQEQLRTLLFFGLLSRGDEGDEESFQREK